MSCKVVQFLAVIALALFLSMIASAQNACTAAGIAGKYVVKCNGYLTPGPNAPMLPASLLATALAEKDGTWSGTGGTLSVGGSIVTQDVKSVCAGQP